MQMKNLSGFIRKVYYSLMLYVRHGSAVSPSLSPLGTQCVRISFQGYWHANEEGGRQGSRQYNSFPNLCPEVAHITSTFILLVKAPMMTPLMGSCKDGMVKD